ncbi:MAG: chemotaxis protein CheW [Alphaproteobacteria bacterium]|nr:chemotaxis protein CheW [Alphaproteobacteria bacterium]
MSAQRNTALADQRALDAELCMFVTMRIDRQLFGVPVRHVRDVLRRQNITRIPLAPAEVAGSLNLRGRIVTVIDLRTRLRLLANESATAGMFVVVDHRGELYSLMVDTVGEVMTVAAGAIEKTPANLGGAWQDVATGIYKLDGELLVIIDVEALLTLQPK